MAINFFDFSTSTGYMIIDNRSYVITGYRFGKMEIYNETDGFFITPNTNVYAIIASYAYD